MSHDVISRDVGWINNNEIDKWRDNSTGKGIVMKKQGPGTVFICNLMIFNRTGHDLEVDDTHTASGSSVYESKHDFNAPPKELGENMSAVGVWQWKNENDLYCGGAVKFKPSPATGGVSAYVGVAVGRTWFMGGPKYTVSAGYTNHGKVKSYYEQFVDGVDSGKHVSSAGNVLVNGYCLLDDVTVPEWRVVATIG